MFSVKFFRFSFLSIIFLFTIASISLAADNWVLLHKGKGGDNDVYYNKQSIKKINDNIVEIYIEVIYAGNKCSIQQVRIDCNNKKIANGLSVIYINGSKVQSMDFSKYGWTWFPPKNSVDRKLLNLFCEKN